jgi:hypothetical protein
MPDGFSNLDPGAQVHSAPQSPSGASGEIIVQATANPCRVKTALDSCLPLIPAAAHPVDVFVTVGRYVPSFGAARDHLLFGGIAALDIGDRELPERAIWIAAGLDLRVPARLIERFAILHTARRGGGARADLEFDPDDPAKPRLVVVDDGRCGCIALFFDPAALPWRPRIDPPIPGVGGSDGTAGGEP